MTIEEFRAAIETAFRAHKLPRLQVHVLYAWARLFHEHPSYRRLAAVSGASVSTVRRALKNARLMNLLSWTRRVVGGPGFRAQISNSYRLGGGPVLYSSMFTRSFKLNTSGRQLGLTDDAAAARDDLAAIAERMTARIRGASP